MANWTTMPFLARHVSWSNAVCVCVCVCVCLGVKRSGTNHNHCTVHTETCNLMCTELLMNTDHMPQTRSVPVKVACRKKWV